MLVFIMLEDVKGFCSEGLGFTFQSTSFTVFSDHLANFDQSFLFCFPSCLNYLKICFGCKIIWAFSVRLIMSLSHIVLL